MADKPATRSRAKQAPALQEEESNALRTLLAAGASPLEYMLEVMRDPEADPARRDTMAKAAAPYAHSRLGTGTYIGVNGETVQVNINRNVG